MDKREYEIKDRRSISESDVNRKYEECEEKLKEEKITSDVSDLSVDFKTFITSLSATVMYHLGVIPDPKTNKSSKNLILAKQTIDIISMLRDKCKGNLTEDEQNLIDYLLYDLRLKYVEECKKEKK